MSKKLRMSLKVSGVALAVSQAFAPNAMAQDQQKEDGAVVVVTGIRASARSSVAIKKDTMEVVDSITAEDIGKLPDPNVAETLTRIPGVQGYRYGGEGASPFGQGSGVTIRGLAGLTASHYNGRAYFTAGSREFNIESAIPGMIAGVDVFKNPSAEHIEGGIGGLVNVRTRNPSDFKGLTAALSTNARYNDLEGKTDPELFGMVANRFDLGGGSRIGVVAGLSYQKSAGRADNSGGNLGPNFKRAIRADSAEYASLAAANTSNSPFQPMSSYVGRSDVNFLANVPTLATSSTVGANMPDTAGLSADQISNIMTAPGMTTNAFQETIMRERKGLNLAADYRVSNTLRFYTETNYTYYLYHQNYRGLFSTDGGNVQNLQTAPFAYTEGLANRNINGGSNDTVLNNRFSSGSFLNSTVRTLGGDEHSPYKTWNTAFGAEWSPTDALSLKGDFSYIKSDRTRDNRAVWMDSANGLSWATNRVIEGEPRQLTFSGPSLSDPNNFVFRDYSNGTYDVWDDKGYATALSGAYVLDEGLFSKLKFGTRFAKHEDVFRTYSFWGRPLTTDGQRLAADQSNGIRVSSMPGTWENSPTNFLDGEAGYGGGYVVYEPDALLGDQVRTAFPQAGIPAEGAYTENTRWGRRVEEKTRAGYLVGDFAAFNDRLKGSLGMRVVHTNSVATGRVNDQTQAGSPVVDVTRTKSYTNYLPSFNATYDITKDFLARFGFGRGMTRPDFGALNPQVGVNVVTGTGSMGNAELNPQTANSYDLSFERYFSPTNYVALGLFNKDIKGFFNTIAECMTVGFAPAYTGATSNNCSNGQYMVSRSVNAEKGYARGVELSGQYFFGPKDGWLQNFGVAGSYTYVDTANRVNVGSVAAPRIIETEQPFVSKNSFSVSGMYEDQKLSARVVYTWRSAFQLGGVAATPIFSRYTGSYGILDAAVNYALNDNLTLSVNLSNILDKAPQRYIGETGTYQTGHQFQHFANGRFITVGLRYKFGA